ncbi:hypothetical protein P43SY_007455 [Pythium insidiosum]|uniref:MULE transposase domain-containing protein n=1 Tax=Pythium insidiosum TaxID=114742 RepID=A0AAD5LBC8_PYTIN|nr:hypothetical protein P43SY_007455 [Pythium insidiosum]
MKLIRDKVKDKYKASRILNALIDAGFFSTNAAAFKNPVSGYTYRYRTRDNNNVDEMEALLANRQYHAQLQEDAAFGFGFPTSESGQPSLSTGLKTPVVIGFASKHSIRNLRHAEQYPFHVDATFKINTARFPSIIMGISDMRRQFRPVAYFIVSNPRQPVLETVFRETFRMYRTVTGKTARLVYIMVDADRAQRNAIDQIVAEELKPRCFMTPPDYAKTNNPVETFNKEIKRDYSLRSLVSVNAQAQAFLDMCYHRACQGDGYITKEAARKLLKATKMSMSKLPARKRNLEDIARQALDRCPRRRIDLDVLEQHELVVRDLEYAENATGDEFAFSAILREAIVDGEPKVLVQWEPTWKPIGNVRKSALKTYRDEQRNKRKVARRAKKIVARAEKQVHRRSKK